LEKFAGVDVEVKAHGGLRWAWVSN
jgi:hypothetical protein